MNIGIELPWEWNKKNKKTIKPKPEPEPITDLKEPDYYEVEAILEHKVIHMSKYKKRDMEVHVKWKGYEETTWESFITFAQDSPEVVQRYFFMLDNK